MIREKENTEKQISNSHEPTETVQAGFCIVFIP